MDDNIKEVERRIEENLTNKKVELDLSGFGLKGTESILHELCNAKHLKFIDISENELSDISFIQNLNWLEQINFESNRIKDFSALSNINGLKGLDISSNPVLNYSFLKKHSGLEQLYCTNNKVLNIRFLEGLKKIEVLSLGCSIGFNGRIINYEVIECLNELKNLSLIIGSIEDINFLKGLTKLEEIDLTLNNICDISPLSNLKLLRKVHMAHNQINNIAPLEELKNIEDLNLAVNSIKNIFPLQKLIKIKLLDLGLNEIEDISVLKGLSNIKQLNIAHNPVNNIAVLSNLHTLKVLDITENDIKDSMFLSKLKKIEELSIGKNASTISLFIRKNKNLKKLKISFTNIEDVEFIKNHDKLESISLELNNLKDISFLEDLKYLKNVSLAYNEIDKVDSLLKLSSISKLDLSSNRIDYIPISFLDNFDNLKELYLKDNPIKNIPKEIFDKDENVLEEVKNYLKSIEKEEDRKELNEAKLIFVGVGEVGKTELSEALSETEYKFEGGRKFTKGIRIKPWQLVDCKREEQKIDFIAHIWDFAGQEINYGTHQFFLTKNSIYVFVWETRKGEDQSKFAYWLRIVSLLSKNAPILVVQNKIDEIVSEVNQKQWKEQFPNIVGFYKTSCKEGTGIDALRTEIQNQLLQLPHTREIWNKYRVAVRDELVEMSKETDYISYKDYLKVCEKHTVSKEDASFLSDQLHNIGSVLHFSEEARLKNTVVLNSEWVTDAAYLLLDTKKVTNGRFDFDNLDTIWSDERFDEKHEFLINLIEKFELIFKLNEADVYIVPEGLPVEEPIGVAEIKPTFENEKTKYLRFEYHYPFMPKGILSRFICRLHENIFKEYFWKNGVVLVLEANKKETFAKVILNEVENPKTIKIEVWGKQADKLLAIIRRNIDHIHSKFEELEIFQKIPCVCVDCKDASKPHFFNYDKLKKSQERGTKLKQCVNSDENIEIVMLLDGIVETIKIGENEKSKLRYFIEQADYRDFFEYLDNIKVSNHEISKLKKEMIGGQSKYDSDFHNRLHVLISTL
ncbi:COR domain-containing protein [Bernardetia sp. MNP-M8]|uniref:COR domain-containing protein n=1 Tax=Bernardetia sp. MNP-M8 TaxID=3127470 RepID=UPI0030CBFD08